MEFDLSVALRLFRLSPLQIIQYENLSHLWEFVRFELFSLGDEITLGVIFIRTAPYLIPSSRVISNITIPISGIQMFH